jgi:hypothetical protein
MKFVRSALVVAAAAMVPLVPTAAHANTYTHTDATGDAVAFTSSTDTVTPEQANGDIAWSKVRHKSRKVVLTMRYRDLNGSGYTVHYYAIRTNKMKRQVSLVTYPGHTQGKVVMSNSHGKTVRCHVTRSIDYTAKTATVRIPRSCLGRPRWVKVGMAFLTSPTKNFATGFADDAGTNGDFVSPAWSPKVFR